MMTPLPFSGLSLLVHLTVIFAAWVFGLVGIKRVLNPEKENSPATRWSKRVTSVVLLLVMAFLTVSFIATAIATGVREGATENHRLIIDSVVGVVVSGDYGLDTLLTDRLEYHRTLIDWRGELSLVS